MFPVIDEADLMVIVQTIGVRGLFILLMFPTIVIGIVTLFVLPLEAIPLYLLIPVVMCAIIHYGSRSMFDSPS